LRGFIRDGLKKLIEGKEIIEGDYVINLTISRITTLFKKEFDSEVVHLDDGKQDIEELTGHLYSRNKTSYYIITNNRMFIVDIQSKCKYYGCYFL